MKSRMVLLSILSLPTMSFASTYVAVNAGVFQGNFNQNYTDTTDVITQDITAVTQQNGYTVGLAVGYQVPFKQIYLLGGELSGNLDSHHALYQSGAATSAFSDTTSIESNIDLTFVPGLLLTDTIPAYLKIGVSYAFIDNNLSTPSGFTPTMTGYSSNNNSFGLVLGLGVAKYITNQVSLFVEGVYRDYGTVTFKQFSNFSATYTHSAHIYASDVVAGIAYHFNN